MKKNKFKLVRIIGKDFNNTIEIIKSVSIDRAKLKRVLKDRQYLKSSFTELNIWKKNYTLSKQYNCKIVDYYTIIKVNEHIENKLILKS